MPTRFLIIAAMAVATFTSSLRAEEWGDLKIKFVYKGKKEDAKKIDVTRDVEFCGKHDLVDESVVVGEDGGLMNVIIYAYDGSGGIDIPAIHPDLKGKEKSVELANQNCRFEPHVVLCQVGDTLKITNPDPVGHNCNLPFLNGRPINVTIPPGKFHDHKLEVAEPAPIPGECNIHPWMQAKVVVLEHPYVAKSGKDGVLTIKNLPAGEKLAFRVYHEKASKLRGEMIGGQEVNRRNVIELEIKPGMNDLGTVELDAKLFE